MRASSLLGAAILTAASAVTAEEKSGNGLPCANDICFTSWKCFYTQKSKYDSELDNRCNVPSYAYTPSTSGSRWNTMVWNFPYYITWARSLETLTEDIVLEWLIFETPGSPLSAISNQTNQSMNYANDGPGSENFIVAYSQKIEKGTTGFNFSPSKDYFPNPLLNITYVPASGYASERNALRIYHPSTFDPKNYSTWDTTWSFSVIKQDDDAMIRHARSEEKKVGEKKLATGVGVGVAVSWTVAFLVAWFAGGWFQKRQLRRKGLLFRATHHDQE